jgi:hypothetical protein
MIQAWVVLINAIYIPKPSSLMNMGIGMPLFFSEHYELVTTNK